MGTRIGIGYDVHKLEKERQLMLGGVEIPFEKGLLGWSDADVVIHAVIDALLGATALGDIGTHFPSDDPDYQDISSIVLLQLVHEMLETERWDIGNIDVTIIAQAPKLAPYIIAMRTTIAETLSLMVDQIGIKAKTANGLGFEGRGEGIAAHAVALVRKSNENT